MATMINATQLRVGHIIEHEGALYRVFHRDHITPGNLRAKVQVKIKNIETGISKEHRFRAEERVAKVFLDSREMEYLYDEGETCVFMDQENYEQVSLSKEMLGEAVHYLTANRKIAVSFHQGKPVGIELPAAVELRVVETDAAVKGATATNQFKPAKVETGLEVQVPPFIKEGDLIKVDTTSGEYLERAETA